MSWSDYSPSEKKKIIQNAAAGMEKMKNLSVERVSNKKHLTGKEQMDWEKDFDERAEYGWFTCGDKLSKEEFNRFKKFISQLLQEQRQEIITEIEKSEPTFFVWFRRWGKLPEQCQSDPLKLEEFLLSEFDRGRKAEYRRIISLLKSK